MNNNNNQVWSMDLWDYSVKIYAFEAVKERCLKLQDLHHVNVDIVLWCCWLNFEGILLPQQVMDEALTSLDAVNQPMLLKLRSVRRSVKSSAAFSEEQAKIIHQQVLNAELAIEKILLQRLQDLTRRSLNIPFTSGSAVSLEHYFELLNINKGQTYAESLRQLCNVYSKDLQLSR